MLCYFYFDGWKVLTRWQKIYELFKTIKVRKLEYLGHITRGEVLTLKVTETLAEEGFPGCEIFGKCIIEAHEE